MARLCSITFLGIFILYCGGDSSNQSSEEENTQEMEETTEDSSCSAKIKDADTVEEIPSAGRLEFQVSTQIDPCSVKAYVVGLKDESKQTRVDHDSFVLDQVPEGQQDVIIEGRLQTSFAINTDRQRGIRINNLDFVAGSVVKRGLIDLPAVGSITGTATLVNSRDHAGIHVYIPGTGYDASTDQDGNYTISPWVVAGRQNLFFEKDGYYRGQLEGIEVLPGLIHRAESIQLSLSTGAKGFIEINQGADVVSSLTVNLSIGATEDAALMSISESSSFEDAKWEPLKTSKSYTFSSAGQKTLYIKFADQNGLESNPFSDSILIDLAINSEGGIIINEGENFSDNRTVLVQFKTPPDVSFMTLCEISDFSPCDWEEVINEKQFTFDADGKKILYARFRDAAGTTSITYSANIVIDTQAPTLDISYLFDGRGAVSFQIKSFDLSPIKIKAGPNSDFSDKTYDDFSSTMTFPYAPDFSFQVKDALNHESEIVVKTIDYRPTLSEARSQLVAACTKNKAIFAGGGINPKIVDIYDATTNTWETAQMSVGRVWHAAAAAGSKILVGGGWTQFGYTNHVDIYDSETKTWTTGNLSVARAWLTATAVGNKILFAGGYGLQLSTAIDIYNVDTEEWSTASLSSNRYSLTATAAAGKAFFAGGVNNSDAVDIYDAETEAFTTATLSSPRSHLAAAAAGSKVLFAGGTDIFSGTPSAVVDIYDVETDSWSVASLSQPRAYLSATTLGNKAIFAGGSTNTGNSDVVDIYDADTNTWSQSNLSIGRTELSACSVGDFAFFAGGRDIHEANSLVIDVFQGSTSTMLQKL